MVSKQRTEQTIYAEFPHLKKYIETLRGDKAEQSIESLMQKWSLTESEALELAKKLGDIVSLK